MIYTESFRQQASLTLSAEAAGVLQYIDIVEAEFTPMELAEKFPFSEQDIINLLTSAEEAGCITCSFLAGWLELNHSGPFSLLKVKT